MRRDPEHFDDKVIDLVHIARKLSEALEVEALLSDAGIDYAVEPDEYQGTILFVIPVRRIGAFFYVLDVDGERVRQMLEADRRTVVPRQPPSESD